MDAGKITPTMKRASGPRGARGGIEALCEKVCCPCLEGWVVRRILTKQGVVSQHRRGARTGPSDGGSKSERLQGSRVKGPRCAAASASVVSWIADPNPAQA
eukprot:749522-Hanusia_phi.AAC.2